MFSNIAVEVENLGKRYGIYANPQDRLKQSIFPKIQRLIGAPPKSYVREFWALRGISFKLNKGDSLGVLGLNGSGKSTLLEVICGTIQATEGQVSINGKIAALLELGAGFNPEFTGIENIYLNGSILGLSKEQIDDRLNDILHFADIGDFVRQPVKTYSSGMYIRLAFAVAIHSEPDILVIDEALAVGDFLFQQKCNLFMKNKFKGVTKIFVSHDISAISSLTEKSIVLERGKLIYFGNTQTAIQKYQTSARASLQSKRSISFNNKDSSGLSIIQQSPASNHQVDLDLPNKTPASQLSGSLSSTIERYSWSIDDVLSSSCVRPGSDVSISILVISNAEILNPIVGYQVQDRFGTVIFGENNVTSNIHIQAITSKESIVELTFKWPEVANARYSITLGVGSGIDSLSHNIVCWAHNIIVLDGCTDHPVHGIFNNRISAIKVINVT